MFNKRKYTAYTSQNLKFSRDVLDKNAMKFSHENEILDSQSVRNACKYDQKLTNYFVYQMIKYVNNT